MSRNITFLELKYGNIYGGYPNFYAISEASLLIYEVEKERIFIESWVNNTDVDVVNVHSKPNELGHTVGRFREVVNLRTRRRKPYREDFRMDERDIDYAFHKLRPTRQHINRFFYKNFRKYNIRDIVVFDGRRDIFLLERCHVDFSHTRIRDLQRELNQATDYLFSLNKLSKVVNFEIDTHLRSNNLEYWLHPIAARQIVPKSAAYDAARLLMVNNEFRFQKDRFLLDAQRLLIKIQQSTPPTESDSDTEPAEE
ncbi:MAG: hypothetical protein AAF738_09000 [Bacteroidota bacterium]